MAQDAERLGGRVGLIKTGQTQAVGLQAVIRKTGFASPSPTAIRIPASGNSTLNASLGSLTVRWKLVAS
jgi:hypothetical protein